MPVFKHRRLIAGCTELVLVMAGASAADACPAGPGGHEPVVDALVVAMSSLSVSAALLPAVLGFWAIKSLLYKFCLKRPVFRDILKAQLQPLIFAVAVGTAYFVYDQFIKAPHVPPFVQEMGLEPQPGNLAYAEHLMAQSRELDRMAAESRIINTAMILGFFAFFYIRERKKIFLKEAGDKLSGGRHAALISANIFSALIFWLAIAMVTTAACGSISH